jgi:hypothetical protein
MEMQKNSCRFINQGKSESIRKVKEYLCNYPNAVPFCIIKTHKEEPAYYFIDVAADNIIVPKDLEDLITAE